MFSIFGCTLLYIFAFTFDYSFCSTGSWFQEIKISNTFFSLFTSFVLFSLTEFDFRCCLHIISIQLCCIWYIICIVYTYTYKSWSIVQKSMSSIKSMSFSDVAFNFWCLLKNKLNCNGIRYFCYRQNTSGICMSYDVCVFARIIRENVFYFCIVCNQPPAGKRSNWCMSTCFYDWIDDYMVMLLAETKAIQHILVFNLFLFILAMKMRCVRLSVSNILPNYYLHGIILYMAIVINIRFSFHWISIKNPQ